RAAKAFSSSGAAFPIRFGAKQLVLEPEAIFNSGSDDDSRIYIDLQQFTSLTGVQPNTALLRVEGRPQEIDDAISRLSSDFPQLEVNPVRQITAVQTAVVGKTRSVVLASSTVIVV